MIACASGCTQRDRHRDDCPDTDACGGCLPRPAADGLQVCQTCIARLRHAISVAPSLVMHIRDQIEPGAAAHDDQPTAKGKKFPPPPLSVEALSAADDLHAELASWALLVMEERHVTGPNWAGSDVRPASKRHTPSGVVYDEARIVGVRDWEATLALSRWLIPHTDWMAAQDWAGDLCGEIPEKVWTLTVRYPTEQRPVYLPVPCPACDCRSLRRYAPRDAGLPVTVACGMANCGHVIEEDGFDWASRVLARERGVA